MSVAWRSTSPAPFLRNRDSGVLRLMAIGLATGLAGCGTRAALAPDPVAIETRAAQIEVEQIKKNAVAERVAAQQTTPETKATVDRLAQSTSLTDLIRFAAETNPAVVAAHHKYLAATHKKGQAFTLPDPQVMFSYNVIQMDPANRKWEIGVQQEIPYPGSLVIAGKIADRDARAEYFRYEGVVRDSVAQAKASFAELYYIDRAQDVTAEIRKLYDRYAALAAGGTEVAKPKLPETFRAESQRAQLGYDLILLREMRQSEVEGLRTICGLPPSADMGRTAELADPPEFKFTLDQLVAIAQQYNQELAAAGVEVERAALQTKLARRAPIPKLMAGASYVRTGKMPDGTDPTKDEVMVNFGVSVPLWFGKYRAMACEAKEMEAAAQAEELAVRYGKRAELAKAYFKLNNAARLVKLYRDTLLPQSRQALQSAEELYRKGEVNLVGLLETTAAVHNFELARLRATADFYQNVAMIEKMLGTALELQPAKAEGPPKEGPKP